GLGNGGLSRCITGCGRQARVALVSADDGIHRIEDRNVDDGKGPAGSVRAPLLPEDPVLVGADRGVVERIGREQDLVPATDRILSPWASRPRGILASLEARPKEFTGVVVTALRSLRPHLRCQAKAEGSEEYNDPVSFSLREHAHSPRRRPPPRAG